MVLLRATQLAGIPIGPETLRELPYRREGVSLGELETALDDIGFDAEIEFGHDPTRLPELSICKLDSPDHFVLVQPLGDNFLKIYSGKGRYELVGTNEFSERFSGYYLRLTAKMNPVQYISSSNGPMPQFETLLIDTGKLNYKDYVNKPVVYEFRVTNVGNQPLEITDVKTTCDCTNAVLPDKPLAPNESSQIRVEYNSQLGKSDGVFSKVLYAETNSKDFQFVRLEVAGAFPGRMTVLPRTVDFDFVTTPVIEFMFVNVPLDADMGDIRARVVDSAGNVIDWIKVQESDVASYNQRCIDRDEGFVLSSK